ncbi:MAG: YggS family pyridoxal phosphate-dependent enzyme [Candidatus Margulisiibacteriota bacterium]
MSIKENIEFVSGRIAAAAQKSGRSADAITLVTVVKNVALEQIEEALDCGITEIGENRVQEAAVHYQELAGKYPLIKWHLIGHLQRNKVRQSLDMFDIIQSVDSERLLKEIDSRAPLCSRWASTPVPVMIEVNTSGESSKFGVAYSQALELIGAAARYRVAVMGLMTMGPLTEEKELIRNSFRSLKKLFEKVQGLDMPSVEMRYLSMGMSSDYEIAIEEGANLVRVGRAIFAKGG